VRDRLAAVAAFLWPFVYLFPYVVPADGTYLRIGNDFDVLYFQYKAYLLDSLAHFDLPWWSPSEAAGFPFYSSPFTQTFYPLNIPLAVFYELANGYQFIDHQRYAVLGIAIFTLGLFCWLRALRFETRTALAAAMVMGVSFKITELLRFPNALHAAAWYPWILLFMTRLAGSTTRSSRAVNGALLAGAAICMVTAGYPYYVIYSPWLFGPYLLVLLVPRWSKILLDREPIAVKGVLTTLVLAGLATALACAPFLYKMAGLMKQTTDRGGQSFEYSTAHAFTWHDTIGSWLFPPASQTEGWYYFGIINVLLILLAVIRRWRTPVTLFLIAWIALITYITYGKSSYLFTLLWTYVPTYSSLRVWGRMNILLVPILAWLLAVAYQHFESLIAASGEESEESREESGRAGVNWRPLAWACGLFGLILAVQLYVRAHQWHHDYWTVYYVGGIEKGSHITALLDYLRGWGIRSDATRAEMIAAAELAPIVSGVVSFLAIASMLMLAPRVARARPRLSGMLLAAVTAIAAADMWIVGPWTWAHLAVPTETRRPYRVAQRNAWAFPVPRVDRESLTANGPFSVGIMPNWYFERYVHFLQEGTREPEALKRLLGMNDGRRVLFSERIDHASIQAALDDAGRFTAATRVMSYTGDEISIKVQAPVDGYLSFIDNWDPDWTGVIDGAPVPIERLFGTFKSVRVRAGSHDVGFAYRPFGVWR
jgi:hypothetical protein